MPEMLREEAQGRFVLGCGERTRGDVMGDRVPAGGGERARSLYGC